ncbi:hypothetical protein FISHEDRAFT_56288 [Fistulina hepatica ATCC 64428]|uniref:PCI domain-containing protein n=1 Tax=Fistulina hepatica ATCC 64428 TaxID=1128425 RepID=A0A0D7AKE0_9AGAR|nr:hypothetical protein FISHEDRAFT_56288 [Fistulina hepatica ATCC 64428]
MDLGNYSSKLEPFLLIGKSIKGAAAAKLIHDATSAPGVFLENSEQHAKAFALLQLFAFRTYHDYLQHKDLYPTLNAAQVTKLKHLSIVSLATERRIIPYSELLSALDMPNVRELEDLIIDAIYLDLLRGKLDQNESQLEVEYIMGRDLAPGSLESVLTALQDWASVTTSVLATLDDKIAQVARDAAATRAQRQQEEEALKMAVHEISEKQKIQETKNSSSTIRRVPPSYDREPHADMMDVDEPPEAVMKGRNRNLPLFLIVPLDTGLTSRYRAPMESMIKQRKRNRM